MIRITDPQIKENQPRQILYASILKISKWLIGIKMPMAIRNVAVTLTNPENKAKKTKIVGPPITKTEISQIHAQKPAFMIGFPYQSDEPINPGNYQIETFPKQKVASVIFYGNFKTLPENPYDKLIQYCQINQISTENYLFELLLDNPKEVPKEQCRIEIQIPIIS